MDRSVTRESQKKKKKERNEWIHIEKKGTDRLSNKERV